MDNVKAKPLTPWPTPLSRQSPRLRNMRIVVIFDTLIDTVGDEKAKVPLDRLSVIKAKAIKDSIGENLAEVEAQLLEDALK